MTTTSTDLTGWYDDLAATWGTEGARVRNENVSERPPHEKALAGLLFALILEGGTVGSWVEAIKRAGWRYVGICDESGVTAMVKESMQPTPPPCPECYGSGRKYVHDAFGGYTGTCPTCDGTGVTG